MARLATARVYIATLYTGTIWPCVQGEMVDKRYPGEEHYMHERFTPNRTQQSVLSRRAPQTQGQTPEQGTQAPPALAQRMAIDPQRLTPSDVLYLQRTAGNRAVAELLGRGSTQQRQVSAIRQAPPSLIQPKLTVGPTDDAYEQEADRVAAHVTRATHSTAVARVHGGAPTAPDVSRRVDNTIQRNKDDDGQSSVEEEEYGIIDWDHPQRGQKVVDDNINAPLQIQHPVLNPSKSLSKDHSRRSSRSSSIDSMSSLSDVNLMERDKWPQFQPQNKDNTSIPQQQFDSSHIISRSDVVIDILESMLQKKWMRKKTKVEVLKHFISLNGDLPWTLPQIGRLGGVGASKDKKGVIGKAVSSLYGDERYRGLIEQWRGMLQRSYAFQINRAMQSKYEAKFAGDPVRQQLYQHYVGDAYTAHQGRYKEKMADAEILMLVGKLRPLIQGSMLGGLFQRQRLSSLFGAKQKRKIVDAVRQWALGASSAAIYGLLNRETSTAQRFWGLVRRLRKAEQLKIGMLLQDPRGRHVWLDSGSEPSMSLAANRSDMAAHVSSQQSQPRKQSDTSSEPRLVPPQIVQHEVDQMEKEESVVSAHSSSMDKVEEEQAVDDTEYRIILAVHRVTPDYVRYQISRASALFKNKIKPKKFQKSKQQIKIDAAKSAIKGRPKDQQPKEESPEWKQAEDLLVTGGDGAIGHAWVKFQRIQNGRPIEISSFGFVPKEEMPGNPYEVVPGMVITPDVYHEPYMGQPGDRYYRTHIVTKTIYEKAKAEIARLEKDPPKYQSIGFNCTKFARKIIQETAGLPFSPPYKPNGMLMSLAKMAKQDVSGIEGGWDNPTTLYEGMMKEEQREPSGFSYVPSSEEYVELAKDKNPRESCISRHDEEDPYEQSVGAEPFARRCAEYGQPRCRRHRRDHACLQVGGRRNPGRPASRRVDHPGRESSCGISTTIAHAGLSQGSSRTLCERSRQGNKGYQGEIRRL